jgi:ElaB/YqjD/DUF883 family membrane-anchored ribosome-binding protein
MTDQNAMDHGPTVPSGESLSSAASVADEYLGSAREVCADAARRVRSFQHDAERYIRENPARAMFTALAVGFVVGSIVRR